MDMHSTEYTSQTFQMFKAYPQVGMITVTNDFGVTRENNWQITSLVTKKIDFHGNACIFLYITKDIQSIHYCHRNIWFKARIMSIFLGINSCQIKGAETQSIVHPIGSDRILWKASEN